MEQSNKIEYLTKDKVSEFLKFINTHWKKDHIFCKQKRIFDYQHKIGKDNYQFILTLNIQGEIQSVLGFIPSNDQESSMWLAIWKSINVNGDGLRILKRLISDKTPNFIGAIGISEDAVKSYNILGWKVNSTKHYYLNLNYPRLRKNKINKSDIEYNLIGIDEKFNTHNNPRCEPFKDEKYYTKRYLHHPTYEYTILEITDCNLRFIGRSISYLGYSVFRIVDVIGEMDSIFFKSALIQYMKDNKIDLIEMVMYDSADPEIDMFLKSSEEVIPLYLSPFINKNIEIKVGYKSQSDRVRFFIGDSDQDRPNIKI